MFQNTSLIGKKKAREKRKEEVGMESKCSHFLITMDRDGHMEIVMLNFMCQRDWTMVPRCFPTLFRMFL